MWATHRVPKESVHDLKYDDNIVHFPRLGTQVNVGKNSVKTAARFGFLYNQAGAFLLPISLRKYPATKSIVAHAMVSIWVEEEYDQSNEYSMLYLWWSRQMFQSK